MEITPEELNKWVEALWNIGWKGLLVFCVIYYKELVIYAGKALIDLITWKK